ncbi:MAG: replication initiator [Nocardioidaceae bacterium]
MIFSTGTPDAERCIGYLAKYMTKNVGECHETATPEQADHVDRLMAALRFEPCSPTCPNWLRYGVQPKDARSGMRPGCCKGKAHKPEHLGYAGRRVLVSRKWSGKTLAHHRADHRAERRAWALASLGLAPDDPDAHRYTWLPVPNGDPRVPPLEHRLPRAIADRHRWRRLRHEAEAKAAGVDPGHLSATAACQGREVRQ